MTEPARITRPLLAWYAEHHRDLPWRRDPTPYHVLLSELMLQQTRVETVLPYFARFLARWPTLDALADAEEDEVLKAWSGLGYYRRARHLLACARAARERGGLPAAPEALRELPGIGPYTAGAVASIAFGVATPVVDGNVERVISRVDARAEDPRKEGRKPLWARVRALHDAAGEGAHPGDLNQALMELGATVCTPRRPQCGTCPLEPVCQARKHGEVERFPVMAKRRPPREVRAVCGLWWRDGGLVMGKRPEGLLGGLWEPIAVEVAPGSPAEPPDQLVAAFRDRCGASVEVTGHRGEVTHVFTHRTLRMSAYDVCGQGSPRRGAYYDEVATVPDPESVALSTLARKILALPPQLALPLAAERPSGGEPP